MATSVQSSSPSAPLADGSIRLVSGSGFRYVTPFPWRLHEMLEEMEYSGESKIVSWLPDGETFKVHDPQGFTKKIIPSWFKHKCYKSFQRQLHLYGFMRVLAGPRKGKKHDLVVFLVLFCCYLLRMRGIGHPTIRSCMCHSCPLLLDGYQFPQRVLLVFLSGCPLFCPFVSLHPPVVCRPWLAIFSFRNMKLSSRLSRFPTKYFAWPCSMYLFFMVPACSLTRIRCSLSF
jgi:hypothetical protein